MTLEEMEKTVIHLKEQCNPGDNVVITTRDPSVGPRASVGIDCIYPGFDWESGQIRITPSADVILYGCSRDDAIEPHRRSYTYPNGRKLNLIKCRRCDYHLRKEDNYCPHCGQKVKK